MFQIITLGIIKLQALFRLIVNFFNRGLNIYEKFNDPFDCQIDIDKSLEDCKKEIYKESIDEFKHIYKNEINKKFAYLCLCREWNQTLMWSHYASNHQGIALGFNFLSKSPINHESINKMEIIYDKNVLKKAFKIFNFKSDDNEKKSKFLEILKMARFMKAECWSYEKEVRYEIELDDVDMENEYKKFDSKELEHIIFGVKCSEEQIREIKGMLNGDEWNHVKYWKATVDLVSLKLQVNAIS